MAETDFTADVTAENGNNVEEEATQETQEEPNPERKCKDIELDWNTFIQQLLIVITKFSWDRISNI